MSFWLGAVTSGKLIVVSKIIYLTVAPISQKDFPDIETTGYATTIGPAQVLQNKPI